MTKKKGRGPSRKLTDQVIDQLEKRELLQYGRGNRPDKKE